MVTHSNGKNEPPFYIGVPDEMTVRRLYDYNNIFKYFRIVPFTGTYG